MWTDDGITYHRQFVLAPDGYDRLGTQFYAMGLLQRFGTLGDAPGRPVLDKGLHKINQAFPQRNLYLGSVLVHWGIEQTQEPELIWTRDLLHFKRFTTHRHSLIEASGPGTYNCGMIRDRYMYSECAGEWWYHYTAINTRHNGYGIMGPLVGPGAVAAGATQSRRRALFHDVGRALGGRQADQVSAGYCAVPALSGGPRRTVRRARPTHHAAHQSGRRRATD